MGSSAKATQQLEQIIANNKQLEAQIRDKDEKIKDIETQYGELTAKFKQVEQFLPLTQEMADLTHWTFTLRDRATLETLMARATQLYGQKFTGAVNNDDEATRRSARLRIDDIATAMLKFACQPLNWSKIYSAYLSRTR